MRRTPKQPTHLLLIAVLTTALGLILGGVGGTAYACNERGNKLMEIWELELVTAEIEGDPGIAEVLVVGSEAALYRVAKKWDDVDLTNPPMRFSKVSE